MRPPVAPRADTGPQITPKLKFEIERADEAMRKGLRLEANPLGPFYSLRFFNEVESVMLLGNTDQLKQIVREINRALDLGRDRKRKRRQKIAVA